MFFHILIERTKASISKNKVSESEKQNRSKILRKISLDLKIKFANNFIGKELDGIQEKNNKVRTNNYIEVLVESSSYSAGEIAKVLITDIKKDKLYGRIIHPHFQ